MGRGLLCCCALGALCAVGDAVKKKKRLCHPHSWNVMHAVHRVCFKWEAEGGGGGGEEEPSLEETGCSRWGLLRLLLHEKDEAQNSLPHPSSSSSSSQKNPPPLTFFFCFWWEIINDDPSRVVWSLADERRGEMWRERET